MWAAGLHAVSSTFRCSRFASPTRAPDEPYIRMHSPEIPGMQSIQPTLSTSLPPCEVTTRRHVTDVTTKSRAREDAARGYSSKAPPASLQVTDRFNSLQGKAQGLKRATLPY